MTSVLFQNAATVPAATPVAGPAPPLSVFDMNTRAIVCLKEGRVQECMAGLRDTLVHTRTRLMNHQQPEAPAVPAPVEQQQPSTAAKAADAMEEDTPRLPLLSLFSVPLFTHQQLLAPGDDLSAHCPLFDRAFVLGSDSVDPNDETWMTDAHCQNVTLGVMLYNLALSHHLTGIYKGVSTEDFRVAINLYQMALSLVESSIRRGEDEEGEECQNLVILLCAIFNNMANIHSRHLHVEQTRNCLECLKEIVSSVGTVVPCVEEDHFFFYLSLFVTAPVHDFAIAPAA
ncbi:expressed unknown protein [Seminavis robusta]|uniref:Uncharacterized protein n=1 Tax=Seminavis robusta TaxID=568900 RepID=A0A9N8DDL6_9STRA|nr:expressed unknown protein [Seminavis robusta]|eukprot:Sro74_g040890.1 n/a (286) ;mRNA; r:102464-103321